MTKRNKTKVYECYEAMVDWFDNARTKTLMEARYLDLMVNSIPPGGSLLDLGCGTGEPIARFFIEKGFKVTGVDGSRKMIELCMKRFPNEEWIVADMRELNVNRQFDAVIAWHSFFHLDGDSQRNLFKRFSDHTKIGGLLVFTSGDEEGEIWSDNNGQMLYHASLSVSEYNKCLQANAFKVLQHNVQDPECGGATVWVCEKIK